MDRRGVIAVAGKMLVRQMAYSPEQVAASSAPANAASDDTIMGHGGVYFLLWQGRIVYVGMAKTLWARLNAHYREGRPHDAVAVIAGLPSHIAGVVEDCYVRAWEPPWNCAATRSTHPDRHRLLAALQGMDKALVMPWFTPTGGAEMSRMKQWQLHALGYRQSLKAGHPA